MTSHQRAILELELSKRKNNAGLKREVGDSLLIAKQILPYHDTISKLKVWIINSRKLSQTEADEIFGTDPNINFKLHVVDSGQWTFDDFPNRLVTFYSGNETSSRKFLGIFNILSISVPTIRNDNKYAFI